MEIEIDKTWKFWIYVGFQIFLSLMVLILVCLVGYFVFFGAIKQLSQSCDDIFGVGNWTMEDVRVRTSWYSIGQEFTCVQNGSGKYYNEVIKEK